MDEHLVSISDRQIQIDPRDLTDRQDVINLVESFGFTDSGTDIPSPWRHIIGQANRLGLFRDDTGDYWLARAQRHSRVIDINHIGSFNTLRTQWHSLDLSEISQSESYQALLNAMSAYAIELKYDSSGVYNNLYLEADDLIDQLEREEIESKERYLTAVANCARKFWQTEVELQPFSRKFHGELLPQTFRMEDISQYLAVQDNKIIWIGHKHEVEAAWKTALSYDRFRDSCSELAAWARNASF